MIAINQLICISMISTAIAVSGCASIQSSRPLTVAGVDTANVQLIENDDGKTAVLTGSVSRNVDKIEIENYVRARYNYEKIRNLISIE